MTNIFDSLFEDITFSSLKLTRYFLKMMHTHFKIIVMVFRLLAHTRTSSITTLLHVCNFVFLMMIVSLSMKGVSYPLISFMVLSCSINACSDSLFKSHIMHVENGGGFFSPKGITLNVYC